jgi:hypothetical protein
MSEDRETQRPQQPADAVLDGRLLSTLGLEPYSLDELLELFEHDGPEQAPNPADVERARGLLARSGLADELVTAYRQHDETRFQEILDQVGVVDLCRPVAQWLTVVMWRVTLPPLPQTCRVNVDAIWFNHDSSSLTADALTIRRNRSQPVQVPEWRRVLTSVAADSPAAYCIQETTGNDVTLRVRFTADSGLSFCWVSASGGGVLGDIDPIRVNFANGVSVPELVRIPLLNHTIGSGVGVQDIAWQWRFRCPLEPTFRDMERTTHRVYVVLRAPQGPWDQTPGSDQNPWTEVLDVVCTVSPTSGFPDPFDALTTGLADMLNWGGVNANAAGLTYDLAATVPHYSSATGFELTKFLERLRGLPGNGGLVNCTDCACIITLRWRAASVPVGCGYGARA